MVAVTGTDGRPTLRVWQPGRQLAFGRRDHRTEGYEAAREAAADHGFPPVERSVGGRAVAYAEPTLAFAYAVSTDDTRRGLDARYEESVGRTIAALTDCGARVERGEPADAYCPGDYSVRATDGGKIAGIAQRVRQDAALVAGSVTVAAREPIRAVLTDVYDALDVAFDPRSVDSVAAAGGPAEPTPVRRALERAFVRDRARSLRDVTALDAEQWL